MEENPFPGMKIGDFEILNKSNGRSECPKCGKSRKFYCYTCFVPVENLANNIPKVKLPIKIDIIKHPSECDGKSTSPHAAVLAPDDVTLYEYPCIPDYNAEKTILIFPGPTAVELHTLFQPLQTNPVERNSHETSDSLHMIYSAGDMSKSNKEVNHVSSDVKASIKFDELDVPVVTNKNSHLLSDDEHVEQSDNKNVCGNDVNVNIQLLSKDKNSQSHEHKEGKNRSVCSTNTKEIETGCKRGLGMLGEASCLSDNLEIKKPRDELSVKMVPKFDRVIFIDSTWNQTSTIAKDERLKDIPRVELKSRKTKFWRNHDGNPEEYLSTIEAIYYFTCDYHNFCIPTPYTGEYDNLLFFFCFMYDKIRQSSHGGQHLKAYLKRQKIKK